MRILIVDDSTFTRSVMKTLLLENLAVSHVETIHNGELAISWLENNSVDLIIMDLEMPILSGEECIKLIREKDKNIPIAVFSSQNINGAERVINALAAGANEFFPKGSEESAIKNIEFIQHHIIPSIFALAGKYPNTQKTPVNTTNKEVVSIDNHTKAIVIGASTGGPEALRSIFSSLENVGDFPIFIVQHMPAAFTFEFAKSLNKLSNWTVKEAENNEEVKPGHVYVAAGGKHLRISTIDNRIIISLDDDEPVRFLKPSIDVFMETIVKVYQSKLATFILSGMGDDGLIGSSLAKEIGGEVYIQSRETCTIWGMPRSISEKDNSILELSPEEIASLLNHFVKKRM